MRENISFGIGALGAVFGWLFGSPDSFFYALIAFMFVDYFTGVAAAAIKKQVSSDIGFEGILKKFCIFLIVAVANIIDKDILGLNGVMRNAAIFFYLSNEGISIIENVAVIGLPVPSKLKYIFQKLNKEEDANGDKEKSDNTEL